MQKLFLVTLFILMTSSSLFAQSQYLEEGESGFATGVGLQTNDAASGIGFIHLGYGSNGKLNLGVQLGKNSDATFLSPYIDMFLLKQNKTIPISMGIVVKADIINSSGSSRSSFSAGGFLNSNIDLSNKSGIIPFATGLFTASNGGNSATVGIGLSLFTGVKTITSFDLGYYVSERNNALVLSISFLFKKNKSEDKIDLNYTGEKYILD